METTHDIQRKILSKLKDAGVISNLQSQLRSHVLSALNFPSQSRQGLLGQASVPLRQKIVNALVAEYLAVSNYSCSLSIFMPESGAGMGNDCSSRAALSRADLMTALKLPGEEHNISEHSQIAFRSTCLLPLLHSAIPAITSSTGTIDGTRGAAKPDKAVNTPAQSLLYALVGGLSDRSLALDQQTRDSIGCQTDWRIDLDAHLELGNGDVSVDSDFVAGQSLAAKLASVDRRYELLAKHSLVDGTTSAEYILKVTREIEQRVEQAAAVELDRIRQGELAAVRMEQQQLYQQQLTKMRSDLESQYQSKLDLLRQREADLDQLNRSRQHDQDAVAFETRQRALEEANRLRAREAEWLRTRELDQRALDFERAKVQQRQHQVDSESEKVNAVKANADAALAEAKKSSEEVQTRLETQLDRLKTELIQATQQVFQEQAAHSEHDEAAASRLELVQSRLQLADRMRDHNDMPRMQQRLLETEQALSSASIQASSQQQRHQQSLDDLSQQRRLLETQLAMTKAESTTLSAQLDSVQRQMHDQSQHQQAAIETAASETRQQLEARARQWQQDYRGDVERVVGELKNAVKQERVSLLRLQQQHALELEQASAELDNVRSQLTTAQSSLDQQQHYGRAIQHDLQQVRQSGPIQSFGAASYPFDYLASGQMPLFPTANPEPCGYAGVPIQLSGAVGARRVKNAWPAVTGDVAQPVLKTSSVSVLHVSPPLLDEAEADSVTVQALSRLVASERHMDTLRSSVERMRATPTTAMAQKTIGSRVSETVENQIVRQNFDRTTHRRSPTTVSPIQRCDDETIPLSSNSKSSSSVAVLCDSPPVPRRLLPSAVSTSSMAFARAQEQSQQARSERLAVEAGVRERAHQLHHERTVQRGHDETARIVNEKKEVDQQLHTLSVLQGFAINSTTLFTASTTKISTTVELAPVGVAASEDLSSIPVAVAVAADIAVTDSLPKFSPNLITSSGVATSPNGCNLFDGAQSAFGLVKTNIKSTAVPPTSSLLFADSTSIPAPEATVSVLKLLPRVSAAPETVSTTVTSLPAVVTSSGNVFAAPAIEKSAVVILTTVPVTASAVLDVSTKVPTNPAGLLKGDSVVALGQSERTTAAGLQGSLRHPVVVGQTVSDLQDVVTNKLKVAAPTGSIATVNASTATAQSESSVMVQSIPLAKTAPETTFRSAYSGGGGRRAETAEDRQNRELRESADREKILAATRLRQQQSVSTIAQVATVPVVVLAKKPVVEFKKFTASAEEQDDDDHERAERLLQEQRDSRATRERLEREKSEAHCAMPAQAITSLSTMTNMPAPVFVSPMPAIITRETAGTVYNSHINDSFLDDDILYGTVMLSICVRHSNYWRLFIRFTVHNQGGL